MSLQELEVIAGFMERAVCPEDIFGRLDGTAKDEKEKQLKVAHRKLAKAVHPDLHRVDAKELSLAEFLFKELEMLKNEAAKKIAVGTYGDRKPLPSRLPVIINGKYVKDALTELGDIADLHLASLESSKDRGNLIMKVARTPDDNDLLQAEATNLQRMHTRLSDQWKTCIPIITDSFLLDEGKAVKRRRVNVMNRFDGFLSAAEIKKRVKTGVDGRTIAWMWKRTMVLLEWTYKIGLIHGAVLPPHLLFYPDNGKKKFIDPRQHKVVLVDWCYSIPHADRTRLSAWVPSWKDYYPPEVLDKKKLGTWTDLFMAATTLLNLINMKEVPEEIINHLLQCTNYDPARRPQSIGQHFEDFTKILKRVYGAPRFHEFVV